MGEQRKTEEDESGGVWQSHGRLGALWALGSHLQSIVSGSPPCWCKEKLEGTEIGSVMEQESPQSLHEAAKLKSFGSSPGSGLSF